MVLVIEEGKAGLRVMLSVKHGPLRPQIRIISPRSVTHREV